MLLLLLSVLSAPPAGTDVAPLLLLPAWIKGSCFCCCIPVSYTRALWRQVRHEAPRELFATAIADAPRPSFCRNSSNRSCSQLVEQLTSRQIQSIYGRQQAKEVQCKLCRNWRQEARCTAGSTVHTAKPVIGSASGSRGCLRILTVR